jgi:hypothetical protein
MIVNARQHRTKICEKLDYLPRDIEIDLELRIFLRKGGDGHGSRYHYPGSVS